MAAVAAGEHYGGIGGRAVGAVGEAAGEAVGGGLGLRGEGEGVFEVKCLGFGGRHGGVVW